MAPTNKVCGIYDLRITILVLGWFYLTYEIGKFTYLITLYTNSNPDIPNAMMAYGLSDSATYIIASAALIYGVVKSVKLMLIPFLITTTLNVMTSILFTMHNFVGIIKTNSFTGEATIFLSLALLSIGFNLYVCFCVLSYYDKIKKEEVSNSQCQNVEAELRVLSSPSNLNTERKTACI
ncbi:uncharacterized protein LOC143914310 isoform X2 [Arctopsyche grandis]